MGRIVRVLPQATLAALLAASLCSPLLKMSSPTDGSGATVAPLNAEVIAAVTPVVTVYGGTNDLDDASGPYFKGLDGKSASASGHSLQTKAMSTWDWSSGMEAWFSTSMSNGKIVVSQMEQNGCQVCFPPLGGNMKSLGVLDPTTDPPTFTRRSAGPMGTGIPAGQQCVPGPSLSSCVADGLVTGTTWQQNSVYNDISDVCTVNRGTADERVIAISSFEAWKPTYGFPALLGLQNNGSGATGVDFDAGLRKRTTDFESGAPDSRSNMNECAVLPTGELAVANYFGPVGGGHSGMLSIYGAAKAPDGSWPLTRLARWQLPDYAFNGVTLKMNVKSIAADQGSTADDERIYVNFDAGAADASQTTPGLTQPVQEFSYNSTTHALAPTSRPVMSASSGGATVSFGSVAVVQADGTLLVPRQDTSGYLAAGSLAAFKKAAKGSTTFGTTNALPAGDCGAQYASAAVLCDLGVATPTAELPVGNARRTWNASAGKAGTEERFISTTPATDGTRVLIVDFAANVRGFVWHGWQTAAPTTPMPINQACDVATGKESLPSTVAPSKGTVTTPAGSTNGDKLFFALGNGDGTAFKKANQYIVGVDLDQMFSQSVDATGSCGVPSVATAVTATPGSGSVTVAWSAPTSGITPITYNVTANPGGQICTVTSAPLSCTFAGLTPGTTYTFAVTAANVAGTSPATTASAVPFTKPGAPTTVAATAKPSSADVSWVAPASNGYDTITGYTVTATPGGRTCSWTSGSLKCTVTGLTPGTAYTFAVTASNRAGTGAASAPSNSVTPYTKPGKPTGVTAVAGKQSADITWAAPASNGYDAITAYTATASPGGKTCSWSSGPLKCTVTGLTAGTAYTFTVTASNRAGAGPASDPSNGITPWDGSSYHATTPTRLLDSRTATGGWGSPLTATNPRDLAVTGGNGVPASATAVVMNVTVTGGVVPAPQPGSYLTVYPSVSGGAVPNAANINFAAGQTTANLVTVKVGEGGKVRFANAYGSVDVVADLVGFYDDGTGSGDRFNAVAPTRLVDSRDPSGVWGNSALTVGATRDLPVRNVAPIPSSATEVILTVTVTDASNAAYLEVFASGTADPQTSTVNFGPGVTTSNLAVVAIGANGKVSFLPKNDTNSGTVHVVVDVVGYFDPTTGSRFHPLSPIRVLDDRNGTGLSGPWPPDTSRALTIAGANGIPAAATGVVGNLGATNGTQNSYLTLYPDGPSRPATTNLLFAAGETKPIAVATGVAANGKVDIYNQKGSVDVVLDVGGYYATT